jgi:hypothetical protein
MRPTEAGVLSAEPFFCGGAIAKKSPFFGTFFGDQRKYGYAGQDKVNDYIP